MIFAGSVGCSRSSPTPALENPLSKQMTNARCNVWTDQVGISHSKSATDLEATACLGFLQARDRAWQMDFLRKITQGRQSEIVGFQGLKSDVAMRLFDFENRAKRLFEDADTETRNWLWAYTHGINKGFAQARLKPSYEMKKLNSEIEPWEPHHTLAILLLQSFDQTRKSFENDILESHQKDKFGAPVESLFESEGLPWEVTILKKGEYPESTGAGKTSQIRVHDRDFVASSRPAKDTWHAAGAWLSDIPRISDGSNNWVLDPSRTKSHKAWLANDPHLALKHPPFWYWAHIQGETMEAMGATLPGTPIVASGFNQSLAWGLTNAYMDVADVFAISRNEIRIQNFRPLIWVRWGFLKLPFFLKQLERTEQGWPILPIESPAGQALVLRWTGFELKASDFKSLQQLTRSRTVEALDRVLQGVGIPTWNYVFADSNGQIAYRSVGTIPRRNSPPIWGVSTRPSDWPTQKLSSDELPHTLRPNRGFVVTANNRQWPNTARFSLGRAHSEGFRAWRIEQLLQETPLHDFESQKQVQCDVHASDADFMVPLLAPYFQDIPISFEQTKSTLLTTLQAVQNWDRKASLDCTACAPYRRWMERLEESWGGDERLVFRRLRNGVSGMDRTQIQSVVLTSLVAALEDLGLSRKESLVLPWQSLHKSHFAHLGGRELFPAAPLATPGDKYTINPGTSRWTGLEWDHDQGTSQRILVELSSPPRAWMQLAGPNENLENQDRSESHQQWTRWRDCQFVELTLEMPPQNQTSSIELSP